MAPLSTRWPSPKTCFSAAWSVQEKTPLRRQERACTQILQEIYRRSQPLMEQVRMSAVPHQHYLGGTSVALVINIMYSIKWEVNILSTRLLQGHNLVITIKATGVLEKFQEEKPPTTRTTTRQQPQARLSEDFSQAKLDSTTTFCPRTAWRSKPRNGPRRCYSMRQQPCAWNSEQPHVGASNFQLYACTVGHRASVTHF